MDKAIWRSLRKIRQLAFLVSSCVALCIAAPAFSQTASSPPLAEDGLWLSQEHDGVFRIGHCGDTLCGRLIGMKYEGDPPKDVWGHPQCGLLMLTGFKPGEDQRWTGHILDPESGHVYDAKIWSPIPDVLKLRGFVLGISLFGETQTWTRYRGAIGADCKLP
ncbi:hypothetical protein NCH01_15850 [Neoasaia chiangmaiensis]|uniref:Uncharacterized protein n=1 Tax=Neoasaia chiangmaiensis TaxID=320497 RepID=A0A1U9KMM0_9PROT|nr:DUF2147 domain-containing protein [Neoasaia chiangmaiensis]AQS87025.1 hypothetical protein A0U93_02665 [Neoasaia chiangmaiensis]GEN15154.1 hypothetical protein NCH01_15850 [Neoasaia chiangmaiensis]